LDRAVADDKTTSARDPCARASPFECSLTTSREQVIGYVCRDLDRIAGGELLMLLLACDLDCAGCTNLGQRMWLWPRREAGGGHCDDRASPKGTPIGCLARTRVEHGVPKQSHAEQDEQYRRKRPCQAK